MTWLQSILLGIIQGATEFLPISSSAHLVLVPYFLNWHLPAQEGFLFDVLLHLGTLLAVIIYFRRDIYTIMVAFIKGIITRQPFVEQNSRLGWLIILATLPAMLAGAIFKNLIEQAFAAPLYTGLFLLVTAIFLVTAERIGKRERPFETISWKDALVVGVFQAISILPGISRSGSTMTGGMLRNLDRTAAARFSFLLSIPVILGASLFATVDFLKAPGADVHVSVVLAGFIAATLVGYLSIRWLLGYLSKQSLTPFAIYCVGLSAVTLIFTFFIRR